MGGGHYCGEGDGTLEGNSHSLNWDSHPKKPALKLPDHIHEQEEIH